MDYQPDFHEEEAYEGGLVRLSRVRYQLSDGQPDAMGWRVVDVEGIEFGMVSDLLADAASGQIVFAAITSEDTGKTALVPVEGTYLDLAESMLIVPVKESEVMSSPEFNDEVVDVMPFVEYWLRVAAF